MGCGIQKNCERMLVKRRRTREVTAGYREWAMAPWAEDGAVCADGRWDVGGVDVGWTVRLNQSDGRLAPRTAP